MKVALMCLPLVLTTALAGAEPHGYLQAGVMFTVQPAGIPNHRVLPALSGTTFGLAAAGGAFVTPTLAVEGEIVAGRSIATPQQFSYNWIDNYTAQSRDVFLGGNVRWRPAGARHLELVGGGGLALGTFAERSIVHREIFAIPPRTSTQPDQVETSPQLALNGGVAVPVPVTAKMAIVPAFTLRWVRRSASGLGSYAGVGSYAYQFGATVRFNIH